MEKHLNEHGSRFPFKNGISLAILLDVKKQSELYSKITEIRDAFDLEPEMKYHPHLTAHSIHFNNSHPLFNEVFSKIKDYSKTCYSKYLKNLDLDFNGYTIIGNPNDPHYTAKFKLKDPKKITEFRMCLYEKFTQLVGENKLKGPLIMKSYHDSKFHIYSTSDNIPLYAVHSFYYGRSNWMPHITLFNLSEIQFSSNNQIGEVYFGTKNYTNIGEKDVDKLEPVRKSFTDISKINLKDDFNILKVSLRGSINKEIKTGTKKRSRKRKSHKRKSRKKNKRTKARNKTKRK